VIFADMIRGRGMSNRRDVYVKSGEVRLVLVATDVRGRSDLQT
jgi:hypothetical protein